MSIAEGNFCGVGTLTSMLVHALGRVPLNFGGLELLPRGLLQLPKRRYLRFPQLLQISLRLAVVSNHVLCFNRSSGWWDVRDHFAVAAMAMTSLRSVCCHLLRLGGASKVAHSHAGLCTARDSHRRKVGWTDQNTPAISIKWLLETTHALG